MRRIDIAKRAGMNLKKAKIRTVLTSLAIAVGATTIALALAAGKGGNGYVNFLASKLGDVNSISVSRKYDAKRQEQRAPGKLSDKKEEKIDANSAQELWGLNDSDVKKISQIDGIREVNPMINLQAEYLQFEDGEKLESTDINSKINEKTVDLTAGKLSGKNQLNIGEVVLPKTYLTTLNKSAEQVLGKKITFNFSNYQGKTHKQDFKIVAVDAGKTDTNFSYRNEFLISPKDAAAVAEKLDEKTFFLISVSPKNPSDIDEIKEKINSLDSSRYNALSFKDEKQSVATAINVAAAGLAAFGGLAVLASVFGIINTQYISVLERTSQIGLMKSLGAKKKEIARLFRYEAAWIGFLGGVIGVVIAWLTTFLNPFISQTLKLKEFDLLQMDWLACAILVLSLMMVSILSGYFPARKAAKLNPIEALRTE